MPSSTRLRRHFYHRATERTIHLQKVAPQHFQSGLRSELFERGPIVGEKAPLDFRGLILRGQSDENGSYRFLVSPAGRSRDSRGGESEIGFRIQARTFRHGERHLLADRTVF